MLHGAPTPAETSPSPVQRPSQAPQRLQERGPNDTLVLHSPYGPTRNATYGWGSLFTPPLSATVPEHPNVHIGISSLNGVPTVGKSDRSMRSLLTQYRKKFNCLEHCYPYHRVGDAAAWQSWADMVKDTNTIKRAVGDAVSSTTASPSLLPGDNDNGDGDACNSPPCVSEKPASSRRTSTVNASRFVFTVKANSLLTHAKQLQMRDAEVQEMAQTFFHQRCPLLEPFLGPVLVQLPPSFAYSPTNLQRLSELHAQLTTEEKELREVNDGVAPGAPTWVQHRQRRLRIAVEFRHRAWFRQETFDLLRSFGWALVAAHHHDDPTFSQVVDTGAGFLYLRLHGPLGQHVGDYGPLAMKLWAEELVHYLRSSSIDGARREVFVFLNNSDSNIGGTTSSTVDATCLAEHLRILLRQGDPAPCPSPSTATSATVAAPPHTTVSDPKVQHNDSRLGTAGTMLGAASSDDIAAPPLKCPRVSTQRGDTRDDEVVIE